MFLFLSPTINISIFVWWPYIQDIWIKLCPWIFQIVISKDVLAKYPGYVPESNHSLKVIAAAPHVILLSQLCLRGFDYSPLTNMTLVERCKPDFWWLPGSSTPPSDRTCNILYTCQHSVTNCTVTNNNSAFLNCSWFMKVSKLAS